MLGSVGAQEVGKFIVDNDGIDIGKLKDVSNVVGLESVVGRDNDSTGGDNAVERFEKGGRVGGQDADSLEPMLLEIVGEAGGAFRGELVGAPDVDAIGRDVNDGVGIGLNGSGALEEKGRREVVDVRWWRRRGQQMVQDGPDARRRARHCDG